MDNESKNHMFPPIAKKRSQASVRLFLGACLVLATATPALADHAEKPVPSKPLIGAASKWFGANATGLKINPAAATLKGTRKTARKAKKATTGDVSDAEILDQQDSAANDPLEPLNRVIFGFNEVLDAVIFTPVSYTYRAIVPGPVRTGVSNAVANAKAPVTFANDLLQGKPKRARTTLVRFLVNSTVGLGGIVDAAAAGGEEKHTEDFGQTLAVWGVGSGPYLVAPVFGPTSPRHLFGRAVDTAATPTTWILWQHSLLERTSPTMADLVSTHEAILDDVKNLRKSSPDFYASVRDLYRQSRKNAISDGNIDDEPLPDIPVE